MARIVFDARTLASARSGIGRFLEGLLTALKAEAPEHDYRLLTNRRLRPELAFSGELLAPWLPKQIWEVAALPWAARRLDADVLHLPQEGFPGSNRRVRRVVIINDLIPLHFQERYMRNFAHAAWYRTRLNAVRRHADIILTISQATAFELQHLLGIEPERLRVIYIPVDSRFVISQCAEQQVERQFGVERNGFFLAIGSADPRKNLVRVLEAHALYSRTHDCPKPLLLFGHPWRGLSINGLIAQHGAPGLVRELGGVRDSELVALYNTACAMVFPSTYEGYGLPVVEAMACGCAVIASATGAVAEAAGEAAMLVDPMSVRQLTEAMERLATDETERGRLALEGRPWATRVTWRQTAGAMLEAYGLG